jgi:precorrin-6B methylase 2
VRRDGSGRYALTPHGEVLRDNDPSGMRARLDMEGALGRAELAFVELLHSVRTGEPAYDARFGASLWDDLARDEEATASFDAQMAADVARWAPDIIAAYDWGALGHIVDVGGGTGALLIEMLRAHPTLRGTVVDQPATAEAARRAFAAAGLADRADAVPGNFFEPLPAGADAYLLTAIVHDWNDAPATAIVRRCAEAAGRAPGGRVFVIEKIGIDGVTPNTQMDLRLLVQMGGRERSLQDLLSLLERSSCRVVARHGVGAIVVVELTPG